jgi:hypothetical protein
MENASEIKFIFGTRFRDLAFRLKRSMSHGEEKENRPERFAA